MKPHVGVLDTPERISPCSTAPRTVASFGTTPVSGCFLEYAVIYRQMVGRCEDPPTRRAWGGLDMMQDAAQN